MNQAVNDVLVNYDAQAFKTLATERRLLGSALITVSLTFMFFQGRSNLRDLGLHPS